MSYLYTDPNPGVPLQSIGDVIERAQSWLAGVANDLPHEDNIQLGGAVFMLEGMVYHHAAVQNHLTQVQKHIDSLKKRSVRWNDAISRNESFNELIPTSTFTEEKHLRQIAHEAVAYINRMGQFFSFAKNKSQQMILVRATELKIFRDKHTAHRSIDYPWTKDTYESKWSQAASLGGFSTMMSGGSPIFQIKDENNNWQVFNILADHPILISECMAVLEAIHKPTF